MKRPQADEYAPYYSTYVDAVPEKPLLDLLAEAPARLRSLLDGLEGADEEFAYAEGKWTVREVLGHVIDTERVFAYRTLHLARADPAPLPGMEQDDWARISGAGRRPLAGLLREFTALRAANAELFSTFDEATLERRGIASGLEFTVRALIYIIVGHERHHRRILAERYLTALGRGTGAGDA